MRARVWKKKKKNAGEGSGGITFSNPMMVGVVDKGESTFSSG
jgi:hypothetical protein